MHGSFKLVKVQVQDEDEAATTIVTAAALAGTES